MRASTLFLTGGVAALIAYPVLALKRVEDDMMFGTEPKDRAQIASALRARFGDRVALLDVPEVNRDVNATVAVVRTDGTVPFGPVLSGGGFVYRFARVRGQEVCIQARQPWEVELVRKSYVSRH